MSFQSRLLNAIPGIRHAFLDVHETAAFPYAEMAPVKLVHGNVVHHYQLPLAERPHADAVFTALSGQKVGVVTADCLPMLMASRDGRYVCSVHAGWRGAASGIVENSLALFRQHRVAPEEIVVAIGPHIHACCYEVSGEFYQTLLAMPAGELARQHSDRLFHRRPAQPARAEQARGRSRRVCGSTCGPLPGCCCSAPAWRMKTSSGWAAVPTARRRRWAPSAGAPISRQRKASSTRGLCVRPLRKRGSAG